MVLSDLCVSGKYEDDLVLEVVVLLGTAAADEGCAMLLCKADILLSLIELLKGKQTVFPNQSMVSPVALVWPFLFPFLSNLLLSVELYCTMSFQLILLL
jgi:hypothetical protein